MNTCKREMYVDEQPCALCGKPYAEHDDNRCRNGAMFVHADTPPCEPGAGIGSEVVGHLFLATGGHLMRVARRIKFHNTDGIDFEVEPVRVNPKADPMWNLVAKRHNISARAIHRTYLHSRECPCGSGFD